MVYQVQYLLHQLRDISDMFAQLQSFIPAFQAFLAAPDKAAFLSALQDPNERTLISLFSNPLTSLNEFKDQLNRARLHPKLKSELEDWKITAFLHGAKELPNNEFLTNLKRKYNVGSFEYTQPAALNVEQPKQGKSSETPSELKLEENLENHLKAKSSAKTDWIRQVNDFAFSKISHETLLALPVSEKQFVLDRFSSVFFSFSSDFVAKFLIKLEEQTRKKNENYRLSAKVLSTLTKEQLLHLGKVYPSVMINEDYVDLWFNQSYAQTISKSVENSRFFTKQEHNRKRQAFLKIIKELKGFESPIIKKYSNKLTGEVLIMDTLVGDPEIERLIDHLQTSNIFQQLSYVNRQFASQQSKSGTSAREPRMRYRMEVDKSVPDAFVEEYVELLLRVAINGSNGESIVERLSNYLEERYLRKLWVKVRLYNGENVENSQDYFSPQELQTLRDRKEIRLLTTNPKKFKVEDDVKLEVAIKNVKKINIKVYVLNLQKHLLGQACNTIVDDEVDLSFLIPTKNQAYENPITNPYQINYTHLDISHLIPKEMGVYIVDFQGETVTSRAVIRKGAIILVDSLTEAGQQFSFFDQSGRPLTEKDGLRVWVRQQPAKLQGNCVFVEYGEKVEYGTVVAALGDYAESFQKKFEEEKYKFQVGYLFGGETFAVGSKAKILLHGRLTMNGKVMSMELLKGTKVRVIVTNHQNIKTSFAFEFDRWGNAQDLPIEFPVQAYIREISIAVETRITLINKKELTLSSAKEIKIDLGEGSSNFLDFYLDQDAAGDYRLSLLGANGEPIANADVIIGYNVAGVQETEKKQLRTNSDGQLKLGPLSIVTRISAEINNSETTIQRLWQIDQSETAFSYSNTLYGKVGQEIVLPISKRWQAGQVLLLRTFDKFYAENLTHKLVFDHGKLRLPKLLNDGYYILKLLPIDRTIEILVLKNGPWQDNNIENQKIYNEDEGTLYEISHNIFQGIAVKDVAFNTSQEKVQAKIALDLQGIPANRLGEVRVHVFANNYLGSEVNDLFNTQAFNAQPRLDESYLQVKRSAYYSSKTFSEEQAYVWSRQQNNQNLVGNNLEKPSIFLKKILVRETKISDEDLDGDGRYIQECAMMEGDMNRREKPQIKKGGASGRLSLGRNALQLNSHNNFLQLSGEVASNLTGGNLTVSIPSGYSSIDVFILTPKTATKSTFSLKTDKPKLKRDLRHTGLEETQEGKGWTMSREIGHLRPGEKRAVNRDSQWRTVGLADIFEFAATKKVKLFDWSNHLLNWHTYDRVKKIQIYDKECCHELNTFLRFKDREFFDTVVAPFISNKIYKTVVDLCLLNHQGALDYTSLSKLESLNAFEKVLLVHTLLEQKQGEAAQSIVDALELEQKSIKRNYEEYKSNFDTIINAKETEAKQQIRPQVEKMMMARKESAPRRMMGMAMESRTESASINFMARREEKMEEKKAFVAVQSTKEYTEKTYCNVTNYKRQAPQLVQPSRFWAELARSFTTGVASFLSESFMYLKSPVEFMLAACFIPSDSSANFQLSNVGDKYEITAKSPMLVYIKEVKQVDYQKKFGVLINQRFFDPNNRVAYEQDGTEYEREVEEFVIKKGYVCQTVINNTSGTPLELQVLLDIPQGAIPLRSHQYTQILNIRLEPYSSQSFERHFYLPEEGSYAIYPSNASRGSGIIAKAPKLAPIVVKKVWTINKLESFEDVLRSGLKEQVIAFLSNRNIFDSNIFRPQDILWMLKDKEFYYEVLAVLRKRRFFNRNIWNFAFLHLDLPTIRELTGFSDPEALDPCAFEYFPYYSSRTHQFANESKSTIRNVEFKESYIRFLVGSVVGLKLDSFEVTYCYYLILQDRLREASEILNKLKSDSQKYKAFEIQYDYMNCFLDLSLNSPNFSKAREITKKYTNYPLQSWNKLFAQVSKTIESQENDNLGEPQVSSTEVFQTQVIQEPGQFKIIQPADTQIWVQIYQINLELYFTEYPFIEIKTFTSIKPSICLKFKNLENTIKRSAYPSLRDATVEITEVKNGVPRKVSTFWWTNSEVKVKLNEKEGTLQVYLNKKRYPSAYVKVFCDKGMTKDFYRDGYTDMTGTFRYAMSDLDGIKEFSILVMTDKGGVVHRVKPPSTLGSF